MAQANSSRRPWFILTLASAGVGAGLFGLSLLGPTPVAAAEPTGSATSASAGGSDATANTAVGRHPRATGGRWSRRAESRTVDAGDRRTRLRTAAERSATEGASTVEQDSPTARWNKRPTVDPQQLTGVLDGPITGTVGASDPEGDPLQYRVVRGPRSGSVTLADDGAFTYTPGANFNGVDTFRVMAVDTAAQPTFLRPAGTRATALINQGAIEFAFTYGAGAQYWTPDRQAALEQAANDVAAYFRVRKPVTLTYSVTATDEPDADLLASAGSDFVRQLPGFWPLVVQKKLLTGRDLNGRKPDGEIEWNFGYAWGLGDTVAADEFDFTSTAMHELLHSFGFLSGVQEPGDNAVRVWSIFDRFVRAADGRTPFAPLYRWKSRYDPALTGADGGFYFGGPRAVAAYGGLVPLFTPNPWLESSSMSHLDDFTFTGANSQLMNAGAGEGLGVRVLSPIEIGILRDLGYHVQPPVPALAVAGLLVPILRRRTKRSAVEHTP